MLSKNKCGYFNLTIKRKLFIMLVIAISVALLLSIVSFMQMYKMEQLQEYQYEKSEIALISAKASYIDKDLYRIIAKSLLVEKDVAKSEALWKEEKQKKIELINKISSMAETPEEKLWIREAKDSMYMFMGVYEDQLLPFMKQESYNIEDFQPIDANLDRLSLLLEGEFEKFSNSLEQKAKTANEEFEQILKTTITFSFLLNSLSTILLISLFLIIIRSITKPLKRLELSMKAVEEGRLDVILDVNGNDEINRLSTTFNHMLARIRKLMDQIVIEQEAKRKSELDALQSQINPHFLYNTLDSVVWMTKNKKYDDSITMTTSLARLFRISISRGKNIIPVRDEIEHAKNYLIIQKYRYKNKFRFEFDVMEEVLPLKTMKLLLQPIIENSIYHGIEYMVDEGIIKISAAIVDDKLLYQVTDNGLGMDEETLKNLFLHETKSQEGSGVGVKNVHERIQLFYGKEYGLEVDSRIDHGTNVKIWLPVVR